MLSSLYKLYIIKNKLSLLKLERTKQAIGHRHMTNTLCIGLSTDEHILL